MYLPSEAIDATLREVGQLAPGSRIAFDFFSHELVYAEAPFEKLGKMMQKGMWFYANEPIRYGVSTKPPARFQVEQLVARHGLDLADYEPYGPEHEAFGGLAMAICRNLGQGA